MSDTTKSGPLTEDIADAGSPRGSGSKKPVSRVPRSTSSMNLVALAGAICLAVGAVAATVITWETPPSMLEAPPTGGTAAVASRIFTDQRLVNLNVEMQPAQSLVAPTMGRLTSLKCMIGAVVESGTSSATIDGLPVISLASAMPMWQDLDVGDTGPDVESLSAELVRLGRLGEPVTRVTSAMVNAYRALATELGLPNSALKSNYIPVNQIAWLPATSVAIASCDMAVGAYVSPGQSLLKFSPTIVAARITSDVSKLSPGERVLKVSGVEIPVGENGIIADPEALALLASTSAFQQGSCMEGSPQVQGQYALSKPLDVSVVPPSAVVALAGTKGCVVGDDGAIYTVTIVGSELGQSFVVFVDDVPYSVELAPSRQTTC